MGGCLYRNVSGPCGTRACGMGRGCQMRSPSAPFMSHVLQYLAPLPHCEDVRTGDKVTVMFVKVLRSPPQPVHIYLPSSVSCLHDILFGYNLIYAPPGRWGCYRSGSRVWHETGGGGGHRRGWHPRIAPAERMDAPQRRTRPQFFRDARAPEYTPPSLRPLSLTQIWRLL